MHKFTELGVTIHSKSFSGEKININDVLNVEIVVEDYKVEPSKYSKYKTSECLYLQIRHQGKQRVIFIGGTRLIEAIRQVPKDKFPFTTTIKYDNKTYLFS